MKTILVVDDSSDQRRLTKLALNEFGYTVILATNAEEALELFAPGVHHLVLTDNSMPGMSGVALARSIKERSPATPVVMLTGSPPATRTCLDAVLQRPVTIQILRTVLDSFLKTSGTRDESGDRRASLPPENPGDG